MTNNSVFKGFVETPPASVMEMLQAGKVGPRLNMSGTELEDSYESKFSFIKDSKTGKWYLARWGHACDQAPPYLFLLDAVGLGAQIPAYMKELIGEQSSASYAK